MLHHLFRIIISFFRTFLTEDRREQVYKCQSYIFYFRAFLIHRYAQKEFRNAFLEFSRMFHRTHGS